jgi:hypothetical protein
MAKAAAVAELNNDAEMFATTSACADSAEWVAALKMHPGAGALVEYSTADAEYLLRLVCSHTPETPVCVDAKARGVLDE